MASEYFTKIVTTNSWGREVTVYRSPDAKLSVELQYELSGDYWWVKLSTESGAGNDGCFNLTRESCLALSKIIDSIERENIKIAKT